MLKEPTLEKLKALKLDAFAAAWVEQAARPETARLSFDERLGLLVDAEWTARENKRLGRVLRDAKLRIGGACIEDVDYAVVREIDRKRCTDPTWTRAATVGTIPGCADTTQMSNGRS